MNGGGACSRHTYTHSFNQNEYLKQAHMSAKPTFSLQKEMGEKNKLI